MEDELIYRVVAAWSDDCPLCDEGKAIFMVHTDGLVVVRSFSCCRRLARLDEEQQWDYSDV